METVLRSSNFVVVISIVELLITLLLAALRQARQTARQVLGVTQAKQMTTATHMFADDHNDSTNLHKTATLCIPKLTSPDVFAG